MTNNKAGNYNKQNPKKENQAAKLAVIAGAITTLGDALATIAAGMALEDELNENNQNNQDSLDNLQQQIDYLKYEMSQMKRLMR
ncbi:hypothetical protein [Lysinibacillus sphaericus]|uniref:hypothetical protein n=1 Tax=Lysinibacillus sphaericus TaxID=1421 RepID=UPI003D019541